MSAGHQDKIDNESNRIIDINPNGSDVNLVDSVSRKPQDCIALTNGEKLSPVSIVSFQAKQAFTVFKFSKVTQSRGKEELPTKSLLPFTLAPPGSINGGSHGKVVAPNINSGPVIGPPPGGFGHRLDVQVHATRGFYSFKVELLNSDGSPSGLVGDPDGQIEC